MKPEKQQLIQDLLGDESRREATLLAGGRILRRRRHWRAATRGLALALVATAVVLSLEQKKSRLPSVQASLPGLPMLTTARTFWVPSAKKAFASRSSLIARVATT